MCVFIIKLGAFLLVRSARSSTRSITTNNGISDYIQDLFF